MGVILAVLLSCNEISTMGYSIYMLRCKFLTDQFFCEELGVGSVPLLVSLFLCCIIHVFYQQNYLKTFAKIVWHIIIKRKHFS